MINWNIEKSDSELIRSIIARAFRELEDYPDDRLTLDMDLTACHCNGCPLDLQKLLDAPAFDFAHDIYGIRRHINRETGKLEDWFLPRCAQPGPKMKSAQEIADAVLTANYGPKTQRSKATP